MKEPEFLGQTAWAMRPLCAWASSSVNGLITGALQRPTALGPVAPVGWE